jgi:hypothetical protein
VDIRRRSSIRPVRESELPIVPMGFQGQQNLGRGKGQCFHHVSEEGKEGDCRWGWKLQRRSGNFRGNYTGRPSRRVDQSCESPRMKMIGKPYSGKLNVRFDEGELEIEPRLLRQFPTLPTRHSPNHHLPVPRRDLLHPLNRHP